MSFINHLPTIAMIVSIGVAALNALLVSVVFIKRHARKKIAKGHEWAEPYEAAIAKLQPHIRTADGGTLRLDVQSENDVGIDPILFADLRRSLEETNRKIRNGEIRSEEIVKAL